MIGKSLTPHPLTVPEPDDSSSQLLLSEKEIHARIRRLAFQILERYSTGGAAPAFLGIHKRGVPLAKRVRAILSDDLPEIAMGTLDISLYRDDFHQLERVPMAVSSDIPFELDGAHVILFDDVLFTGRTIRAAINSLMDYGRPACIELATLIDRGCRELPIQADYVAFRHETTRDDYIRVRLKEFDDEEGIWLLK